MKHLFVYYLLILVPIGIIGWLLKNDLINAWPLLTLIFFYALIYRTYIDGKRLADKNIIKKKDIWKLIISGTRLVYFKELYLK